MMFPIYIPSKGRVSSASTCTGLDREAIPYFLVTTRQEADAYRLTYQGTVLPLQQEGGGIARTRNLILDQARGQEWIWMIDDDITALYRCVPKQALPWSALNEIEHALLHLSDQDPSLALVGLSAVPVRACREASFNTHCYMIVAINVHRLGSIRYNEQLFFYSDTELLMQILSQGLRTARLLQYGYHAAPVGNNPGGLYQEYQDRDRVEDAKKLQQGYGEDIITLLPPPYQTGKATYTVNLQKLARKGHR